MARIHETIQIEAEPDRVWDAAGDPGRIADWLPLLTSSRIDGDSRECTIKDGGELRERILEHSDEDRSYSYEILEGPMPIRSYRSRLSVEAHNAHSHVDWEAEFEPEQPEQESALADMFTKTCREGLESLRERLES
jgi:protein-tyrosine phosphatase